MAGQWSAVPCITSSRPFVTTHCRPFDPALVEHRAVGRTLHQATQCQRSSHIHFQLDSAVLCCAVLFVALTVVTAVKNKLQFFVLRLVLGISEAGAFPGMWHYLNSFYPPDQVTVPYALVEAAVGVANVVAAPLAASLLLMDGVNGWHGWQW